MPHTGDSPQVEGHTQTGSEGLEREIPWRGKLKEAGVATLTSDKTDFYSKSVTRDKEGHYVLFWINPTRGM